MADKSTDRKIKTVTALQNVGGTLTRTADEIAKNNDQYLADGGDAAFNGAFFTSNAAALGVNAAQFADLRQVILDFVTWSEEAGEDRIGKLLRARLVG